MLAIKKKKKTKKTLYTYTINLFFYAFPEKKHHLGFKNKPQLKTSQEAGSALSKSEEKESPDAKGTSNSHSDPRPQPALTNGVLNPSSNNNNTKLLLQNTGYAQKRSQLESFLNSVVQLPWRISTIQKSFRISLQKNFPKNIMEILDLFDYLFKE